MIFNYSEELEQKEEAERGSERNFDPWPDGDVDFKIRDVAFESSKGNKGLLLWLDLFNGQGGERKCVEWIGNIEKMQWKRSQFFRSLGPEPYMNFKAQMNWAAEDLIGKGGRCRIKTQEAQGEWAADNKVAFFYPKDDTEKAPAEDDIPY